MDIDNIVSQHSIPQRSYLDSFLGLRLKPLGMKGQKGARTGLFLMSRQ